MNVARKICFCLFFHCERLSNQWKKQHEHREKPNEREKTTDLVGVVCGFELLRLRHTVSLSQKPRRQWYNNIEHSTHNHHLTPKCAKIHHFYVYLISFSLVSFFLFFFRQISWFLVRLQHQKIVRKFIENAICLRLLCYDSSLFKNQMSGISDFIAILRNLKQKMRCSVN